MTTDEQTANESIVEPPPAYVGRVGILLFAQPHRERAESGSPIPTTEDFYDRLIGALDGDPRVGEVRAAKSGENVFRERRYSMAGQGERLATDAPAAPHRHIHVAEFETPILLNLHVPKRLQAGGGDERSVPADEYWVSWDGVQLLVLWDYSASNRPTGFYGGLIAVSVLHDAVKKIGLTTKSQPCGPYCSFPFSHQDLLIAPDLDTTTAKFADRGENRIRVSCPPEPDPLELARRLSRRLSHLVSTFATMRSFGETVSGAEKLARQDVSSLLKLQYELAETNAMHPLKSLPKRWRQRGRRKQMAHLIAKLWMRLATLEENYRHWKEGRFLYDSSARSDGLDLIFRLEYPQSQNSVGSVDIVSLRATVEQLSARADSHVVAIATIAGATSGAVVAGFATLLASLNGA
ncbi:hypothetical protein [uncultured Plantibacter sp.]|uniref:hypothetical protein n=1 Tax=uncultured Plantibacter sp. TaxID=293337 RepID=UPI0028D5366B|nr:hypothetical protein [uncultured Plantibacter sp.]